MGERYSQKAYPRNPFRYYLAMRRFETISNIFRFYFGQSSFILDLGCGVGEYFKYGVTGNSKTIVGVDLNKLALQNRKFNFIPIRADAQNLPFKENVFDLVLFSEVLEHLPYPEKALDEIKKIISPGGILIISTPSKKSIYEKQYLVFIVYFCIWVFQKLTGRKATWSGEHISLQLPNELKDMLKKRGLKIVKELYTGFCLPFTGELLNFLFKFSIVQLLYRKLDEFVNRRRSLASLNWNMIFVCKKLRYSGEYSRLSI